MENYEIKISTRKNKKYDVFKNGNYHLSFGDSRYQQYKDTTPLKHYSNLDHNDKQRLKNYYSRFRMTGDKNLARYWSNKFLWPL